MNKNSKETAYKAHATAKKSVLAAAHFFEKLGFQVLGKDKNISSSGPDLTIIAGHRAYRVEVKTATFSSKAWKVTKTNRVNDDYVAIVFPSGAVHVEPMVDHSQKCAATGARSLTAIGLIYEQK